MIIITVRITVGHESIWGTVWGIGRREEGERILKSEENRTALHVYI
jgi:hypothetical protein